MTDVLQRLIDASKPGKVMEVNATKTRVLMELCEDAAYEIQRLRALVQKIAMLNVDKVKTKKRTTG